MESPETRDTGGPPINEPAATGMPMAAEPPHATAEPTADLAVTSSSGEPPAEMALPVSSGEVPVDVTEPAADAASISELTAPVTETPIETSESKAETASDDALEDQDEGEEDWEEEPSSRGLRFTLPATIFIALLTFLLGGFGGYWGRPIISPPPPTATPMPTQAPAQAQATSQPQPTPDMKALLTMLIGKTRHFKGNANAPVTIIEFADFQCPYCGRFYTDTAHQIDDKYVKDGTVRFGYMNFAFLGDESQWAAEAAECADEQGQYWEYHDKLFTSQNGENQGAFAKDKLKGFAADLKLDATQFDSCLDSGKYTSAVQTETQFLTQLGIQSTPTFLVGTTPVQGAESFDTFSQLIEAAKKAK